MEEQNRFVASGTVSNKHRSHNSNPALCPTRFVKVGIDREGIVNSPIGKVFRLNIRENPISTVLALPFLIVFVGKVMQMTSFQLLAYIMMYRNRKSPTKM